MSDMAGPSTPISPTTPMSAASNMPFLRHNETPQVTPTADSFTHRIGEVPWDADIEPNAERPFRTECLRVVATFLKPNSPKELNLDAKTRNAVIHDTSFSSHPDVVRSFVQFTMTSRLNIYQSSSCPCTKRHTAYWKRAVCLISLGSRLRTSTCRNRFSGSS